LILWFHSAVRRIVTDSKALIAFAHILSLPINQGPIQSNTICAPAVSWYNSEADSSIRIPVKSAHAHPLALLIGNTKRLWTPFLKACAAGREWRTEIPGIDNPSIEDTDSSSLCDLAHPLNTYVEAAIQSCVQDIAALPGVGSDVIVRWSHHTKPGELVGMQQVAEVARFAFKSPEYLSVNDTYGPWFGLRAVVLCPGIDFDGKQGPPLKRPYGDKAAAAMHEAFEHAMSAATKAREAGSKESLPQWRLWLAIRDACPVGVGDETSWRYSDD